MEQSDGEQKLRFACWLNQAIEKHSAYIERTAFSRKQWLLNRTTLRLYEYCDLVLCLSLNRAAGLH